LARRLPVVSGKRVVRALQKRGFEVQRVRGSHHLLRHPRPPVRNVTVPVHGNKPLKRATVSSIIKQAGLSVDAFVALL